MRQEHITLMGLTALLDCNDAAVLAKTPQIIEKCVALIRDIQEKKADTSSDYAPKNSLIQGSPGYRTLYQVWISVWSLV